MKILKWIFIVIIALIAIFLIYSASQPSQLKLEETIVIDASKEKVFNTIIDFRDWGNWSAWDKMDPDMKQEYSETMGEVGSYNKWWSENPMVGNGGQEVVEVRTNEYLKSAMTFECWEATNYAEFILSEEEGGTKVLWTYEGAKTPFYMNFMNTMIEPMLRENYIQSLKDLKAYVEGMPADVENPFNLEVMDNAPTNIITITDSTDAEGISKKLGELYTELTIFLETTDGANQAGMPLAIYHEYSPEKVVLEAALAYSGTVESEGRVMAKSTPEGKVIKGIHLGSYESSEAMHYGIIDYAKGMNLEIIGSPWEVYANDPTEVDSSKIETHIFYPVK